MVALWIAVGVLSLAVCLLVCKVFSMQKAAREIAAGLAEHLQSDTNTLICVSTRDRHIRALAASINRELRVLREMRHRYQNGDKELKSAVTNISHDLRTPLTAICGYLDLLEAEEKSEQTARYVAQIANRIEVLKSLTEELFRFSVISSEPALSPERLNVCRVLEDTLVSFYGAFEGQKIVPRITLPKEPVWRVLDASALSRIFNNVVSNAVKYSDGDFSVCMSEDCRIVFSNTAHTLSAVDVEKLFDRFFTVNSARSSTGLGLSIAKLLTERLGGTINAQYSDGKLHITVMFPDL
ncbi:MAG: HAMP domain-containing histidine kinase [Clostridia bacterium]|nr:HAMP domain-containing histidine kinase [Clostridia bacterium]